MQSEQNRSESSDSIQKRVSRAYQIQFNRAGKSNADLGSREVARFCKLQTAETKLLDQVTEKLKLSTRAYHRILKLARTIADLGESENITSIHLTEAISYRSLDRLISN